MEETILTLAPYAAVTSGIFWLIYLGLVMIEYTGKVPYTTAYKALGISSGVLQALPIIIPAAALYEAFGDGAHALNVAGFIAVCASVPLISISVLKMLENETRFEDVSDLMQAGFALLGIWLLAVAIMGGVSKFLPSYLNVLGAVAAIGMVSASVIVLIYGPISPGIKNERVPPAAVSISYLFGGIGFLGYPVWVILLAVVFLTK
jgi:hypothetical protein